MSDLAYNYYAVESSLLRKAIRTKPPRKSMYILPLQRAYTYNDYKEWELAPGERYELIDGTPCAMAAPNAVHQAILMELYRQVANFLLDKPCKAFPAPYDVRLFYQENGEDDTVVQPDLTVVCDAKKRGLEGCRGAPDLVVEVLSPSNNVIEMYRKLELYQKAGVREYWVVDPAESSILVYTFPKAVSREYKMGDTVCSSVLAGLSVNTSALFDAARIT